VKFLPFEKFANGVSPFSWEDRRICPGLLKRKGKGGKER
jgi:hypothetical protein